MADASHTYRILTPSTVKAGAKEGARLNFYTEVYLPFQAERTKTAEHHFAVAPQAGDDVPFGFWQYCFFSFFASAQTNEHSLAHCNRDSHEVLHFCRSKEDVQHFRDAEMIHFHLGDAVVITGLVPAAAARPLRQAMPPALSVQELQRRRRPQTSTQTSQTADVDKDGADRRRRQGRRRPQTSTRIALLVEPDDSFDAVIRAAHRWCGDDMYDAIYAVPRDVMRVCFSVRFTTQTEVLLKAGFAKVIGDDKPFVNLNRGRSGYALLGLRRCRRSVLFGRAGMPRRGSRLRETAN